MRSREEKIKACIELVCANSILVLATQSEKGPHTSLMAYACSPDGTEIYMVSSKKSRKWENIQRFPKVSMLIDDRDGKIKKHRNEINALTVSGTFIPIDNQSESQIILKHITRAAPSIGQAFSGADSGIIRIKVHSFLLLDGPEKAFYSGPL